jgi:penicillin-binding protein
MPGGIVRRSFCGISGLLPSDACSKAGLVQTDLFNAKYVPTTVDDSLVQGKYVTIGDKKYLALDSTPAEFAESGMILNPDYIQKLFGIKTGVQNLIPKKNNSNWSNILLPDDKLTDNGKAPSPLSIGVNGNQITWGSHPENDIVGYRVYMNGNKVASIKTGSSLAFSGGNGKYYVTAVDIAGQESAPSNEALIGPKEEEKPADPPATDPGTETGTDPGTGGETGSENGNENGTNPGNNGGNGSNG